MKIFISLLALMPFVSFAEKFDMLDQEAPAYSCKTRVRSWIHEWKEVDVSPPFELALNKPADKLRNIRGMNYHFNLQLNFNSIYPEKQIEFLFEAVVAPRGINYDRWGTTGHRGVLYHGTSIYDVRGLKGKFNSPEAFTMRLDRDAADGGGIDIIEVNCDKTSDGVRVLQQPHAESDSTQTLPLQQ